MARDKQLLAFEQQTQAESLAELKQSEGYRLHLSSRSRPVKPDRVLSVNESLALSHIEANASEHNPGYRPSASELDTKAELASQLVKWPNKRSKFPKQSVNEEDVTQLSGDEGHEGR